MKRVEGLTSTNWLLQNSNRNIVININSIGNIVDNILITMYGVIWV